MQLTQEQVKTLFDYNKSTGHLRWKVDVRSHAGKVHVGAIAGHLKASSGYVVIGIDGKTYMAHRIIWLWVTGQQPPCEIDHKNGVRNDNRWRNLRAADRKFNGENLRKANTGNKSSGVLGVWSNSDKTRHVAGIKVDGKRVYLGSFRSVEAASAAYISAKRKMHRGCTL